MSIDIDRINIEIESGADAAAGKIDVLENSLNRLKRTTSGTVGLGKWSHAISMLKEQTKSFDLSALETQVDAISNAMGKLSVVAKSLDGIKGFASASREIARLPQTFAKTQEALDSLDVSAVADSITKIGSSLTAFSAEEVDKIERVSKAFANITPAVNQASDGMQRATNITSALRSSFGSLGSAIANPIGILKNLNSLLNDVGRKNTIKSLVGQFESVSEKIKEIEPQLKELEEKIKVDTGFGKGLVPQQQKLEEQYKKLLGQQDELLKGIHAFGSEGKQALAAVGQGAQGSVGGVMSLKTAMDALNSSMVIIYVIALAITAVIKAFKKAIDNLKNTIEAIKNAISKAIEIFKKFLQIVKKIAGGIKTAVMNLADSAKRILNIDNKSKGLEKTFENLSKVWSKLWNVFQIKVIRSVLNSLFSGVSEGLKQLALEFSEFNQVMSQGVSAVQYFKNSLAASLAPAIAGLMPLINTLLNAFARLFEVIGAFFSMLFGTPFYTAKSVALDYAGALDDVGSAAKQAAKDMNLLPFDELNTISQDMGNMGGGGGGGGGINDWFQESTIPDWITDIFENPYDFSFDLTTKFLDWLSAIDWVAIKAKARQVGQWFGELTLGAVDAWFYYQDSGIVGRTIAELLNTGLEAVGSFFDVWEVVDQSGLNGFQKLGTMIGKNITSAVQAFDWKLLVRVLSGAINGVIDTLAYMNSAD